MHARPVRIAIAASSLGPVLVGATERGVCLVRLGDAEPELRRRAAAELPFAVVRDDDGRGRVAAWAARIARYVDGHETSLDVPLDVSGSRFQRRVWEALRTIPRGRTVSYAAVARRVGVPHGARAVARACAANPALVVIPCHRVVPAGGGPGGYAAGAARKRELLEREGALAEAPAAHGGRVRRAGGLPA